MMQPKQTTRKHIEYYKYNPSPAVPTLYDFRQFQGYVGECKKDILDQLPAATD